MSVELGLGWLVAIDTNDTYPTTPNWVTLPNQKTGDLELDREHVEINTKQDAGWKKRITHSRDWSIPVSGYGDEDDAAILFLVDTKALGSSVDVYAFVKLTNADGDTYIGQGVIDGLKLSAPQDGPVEYSCTFKAHGALTLTRA